MMGVATLLIAIFHSLPLPYILSNLQQIGEIGVDIFLFVGGYTCSLSLQKSSSLVDFYLKRIKRVYAPFAVIVLLYYGYQYFILSIPNWNSIFCITKLLSMCDNYTNNSLLFWYIPMVLLMYLMTPLYIIACNKVYVFKMLPLVIILYFIVFQVKDLSIPMFMFWNRLPIYLLGVNLFLKKAPSIKLNSTLIISIISFLCFILIMLSIEHSNVIDISFRRFLYIPLVFLFVWHFRYNNQFFRVFGVVSLEVYIFHGIILSYKYLLTPHLNYFFVSVIILLITFCLSLLFSFCYHTCSTRKRFSLADYYNSYFCTDKYRKT